MKQNVVLLFSIASFAGIAIVVQSCGGSDDVSFDGGKDTSTNNPDTTQPPIDTGVPTDTSTGNDVDIVDTGVDAGPLCTSTPCVLELAVGPRHACVRINDGTVRCWGRNTMGEVGTGVIDGGFNPAAQPTPVQVSGLTGITQVSASGSYTWGPGTELGHSCALKSSEIQCWGGNSYAQLGRSAGYGPDAAVADNNPHPTPAVVQGLSGTMVNVGNGSNHGCAVLGTGQMACWGDNYSSMLGRGMPGNVSPGGVFLVGVDGGATVNATQTASGDGFTLALQTSGNVLSWGNNQGNELARTTTGTTDGVPQQIPSLSNVTQVAAGEAFACAVTSANALLCWGDNGQGQLGRGLTGNSSGTPTTPSLSGKLIKQVATGAEHACAVVTDGTVVCWGDNDSGQVGQANDGGTNPPPVDSPVQVSGLTGKALSVGCGGTFSCALIEGGSVMCWGSNFYGQLGRGPDSGVGSATAQPVPVTVTF